MFSIISDKFTLLNIHYLLFLDKFYSKRKSEILYLYFLRKKTILGQIIDLLNTKDV